MFVLTAMKILLKFSYGVVRIQVLNRMFGLLFCDFLALSNVSDLLSCIIRRERQS